MAGHSKWANIKHRKGTQDKRRAKLFTRLLKDIAIAVKNGSADPAGNPALRLAVQNARGANIPRDRIENAIKKAAGADSGQYMEFTYEAYGPGGAAVIIETATDNPNRTVASIRTILSKFGGSLSTLGSLDFVFTRKGVFELDLRAVPPELKEELEYALIDSGAEEIEEHEQVLQIITPFEQFGDMQKKLESMRISVQNAAVRRLAITTKALPLQSALKFLKMLEQLEDDDDIQTVYHNLELTPELAQILENES